MLCDKLVNALSPLSRRQLLSPWAHTSHSPHLFLMAPECEPLCRFDDRSVQIQNHARQTKLIRPRADSTLPPFLIRHRNRIPSMTPAFRRNESMSAEYAHPLLNPQNRSNTTTSPSMISSCTCPSFRTGALLMSPWSIKPASTSTHYLL